MQPQRSGCGVGWKQKFPLLHFCSSSSPGLGSGGRQWQRMRGLHMVSWKLGAHLNIYLSRSTLCICKMRLAIPRGTGTLMNLVQPSFEAQKKGEGESIMGTCFLSPIFLPLLYFSRFPSWSLGQVWGAVSLVSCQYSPLIFSHRRSARRAGLQGKCTMKAAQALVKDLFGFQNAH